MVMFTLSKIADILHLGNPVGIVIVYLGFGAGLCGLYVLRICEIHSARDRGGCHDRRLYSDSDILQNCVPGDEADGNLRGNS